MDLRLYCLSGLSLGLTLGAMPAVVHLIINTFFIVGLGDD